MTNINITYESLYDLLRKERSSEDIQELDKEFFKNVSEYMGTKKEILSSQESKDSIFTHTEAQKTRRQIEQIQKILKELYERREHKIVQLALFSSRTNSESKNQNLLDEEIDLYLELKRTLSQFRDLFFDNIKDNKIKEIEKSKVLKTQENQDSLARIRIIKPIPKFVGDDLNIYGPFEEDDIASLSGKIANLLIENGKAELMKNESSKSS